MQALNIFGALDALTAVVELGTRLSEADAGFAYALARCQGERWPR
jgi:hypothetical protein